MNHATTPSGEALIVLTAEEYRALAEDGADAALTRAAAGADAHLPGLPAGIALAVAAGILHPLTAWRQARGLTIAALSEAASVRAATVSDIENGKIDPRISTVRALAEALGLDIDDIV